MIWYFLGMLVTYLSMTSEEKETFTSWHILLYLLIWPVTLGIVLSDMRWEIQDLRKRLYKDDAGT